MSGRWTSECTGAQTGEWIQTGLAWSSSLLPVLTQPRRKRESACAVFWAWAPELDFGQGSELGRRPCQLWSWGPGGPPVGLCSPLCEKRMVIVSTIPEVFFNFTPAAMNMLAPVSQATRLGL